MSWTQADLDAINKAIAGGVLTVRFSDGRMVTYQSLDALLKIRALMADSLAGNGETTPARLRRGFAVFRS